MKVVLLASGRSMRMAPLGDKIFLNFLGEPLLVHHVRALQKAGFKDVCVVGGAHNISQIKKLATITVCEQKNLEQGMAGGVLAAASWVKNNPFVVVSANDLVDAQAYQLLNKAQKSSPKTGFMLAAKVSSYFSGGYLGVDAHGRINKIVEKPGNGNEPSDLVNIVMHYHPAPQALFELLKKTDSPCDDCYEKALQQLFDAGAQYMALPYTGFWKPIKYPWHILDAMKYFLGPSSKRGKNVQIAKSATIKGEVVLDDGVKVLENAVIQGPAYIGKNTVIATNALVRESHIGKNCVIGFGSEVARSFVGDQVWTHTNYIGDSVIGSDVSFGAGTVTGNLRFDEKNVRVVVSKTWNGKSAVEVIDSGRDKLGLITGDHIRTGINASFMPGVKVGSNSLIGAGVVVAQNIPENSFVTGEWSLKIRENKEKISPRNS